jgi:hypothetical protein
VRGRNSIMNWKYYIPHIWDSPRTVWEDVWLLPDDLTYSDQSLWLTVDALGDASDPSHGDEREEFQREALEKLGDQDYWIEAGEMIVRTRDFTKEELLEYVSIWLRETGLPVTALVEAPREDFAETNEHARIIMSLCKESEGQPTNPHRS